jgi:hypothetical protein
MKNALIVEIFNKCMDVRGPVSYLDMKYCLGQAGALLDVLFGPKEIHEPMEERSLAEEILLVNPAAKPRGRPKKTSGETIPPAADTTADVVTVNAVVFKSPEPEEMPHAAAIEAKREMVAEAMGVEKDAVQVICDSGMRLWNPGYPSDRVLVGKALGRTQVPNEWLAKHKMPLEEYLKFHAAKACQESINPLVAKYILGVGTKV